MYQKVKDSINERVQLHLNDPRIPDYWNKIVDSFEDSEQIALDILNQCTEYEIDWLREVFDDLAIKFPSENYIKTLESIQQKYPKIDMQIDIEFAKKYI
ncbi:hypothetical protein PAECIP111891_07104 [Paenibacillus allorhizoplanae]|uniref:Uncharacterized protein n=2 Tax=Paenibacillus allorhizoplanae TaxID=2905648 RepID=A0ABN8HAR9_9BACL|nr:hypothetical protein PAECIP111891_07104 [Paenibacillus allorhizoplanae]